MSSTLALVQRDLILTDTDSARNARETLDRLKDMAQDHFDHFYEKIWYESSLPCCLYRANLSHPYSYYDQGERSVHMNEVLNKYTYIGVAAGGDNLIWMDEVREAFKEFSIGPFVDGLSSVATNAILKMIHSSAGRYRTQQRL